MQIHKIKTDNKILKLYKLEGHTMSNGNVIGDFTCTVSPETINNQLVASNRCYTNTHELHNIDLDSYLSSYTNNLANLHGDYYIDSSYGKVSEGDEPHLAQFGLELNQFTHVFSTLSYVPEEFLHEVQNNNDAYYIE